MAYYWYIWRKPLDLKVIYSQRKKSRLYILGNPASEMKTKLSEDKFLYVKASKHINCL